ncbi:MAG: B12-binding domain-containing radical SAM protein, partial [Candidatus Sumerlaeia bacterium]|nr:B12-binding domain-containing radical SAM protein [Candidatus Sumerlaeia bacterium]
MGGILLVSTGADNPEAMPESPSYLAPLVLEAALRGAGMKADVFLYFEEPWQAARQRLLAQVREKQYDLIGLSFMSYNRLEAYELLRDFQQIAPATRIIAGGVHASFLYEQLLRQFPNIAAVAIGEGEPALVGFCRHPDRLETVPGIAWRRDGGVVVNRPAECPPSLDTLPAPNYELIRDCRRTILIQTSRGCVGKCGFCAWRSMETVVRWKSPERIVHEWRQIREVFGPDRRIAVIDPLYNISLKHVKAMCRALIEAGLTTNPWDAQIRAKPMDREALELMKQAGCKRILIGVEAGNEQIRRAIGKGISNADIERIFALAREVKMPTVAFFMVGLPGETDATVGETIEFVRSIRPYYNPLCGMAEVYPGTRLYEIMKQRGLMSDDYWLYRHPKNCGDFEVHANMPLFTAEHSAIELIRWSIAAQQALAVPQSLGMNDLVMDETEYDRHDPCRAAQSAGQLDVLVRTRPSGTWKGRARRLLRGIRTALELA